MLFVLFIQSYLCFSVQSLLHFFCPMDCYLQSSCSTILFTFKYSTSVAFMLLHYLTTVSLLLCSHTKVHPFILSTIVIVHDFHIYHTWPCSFSLTFTNKLRSTILLKYIYSWTDIRTYASKPDFTNIIRSMKVYEGHK